MVAARASARARAEKAPRSEADKSRARHHMSSARGRMALPSLGRLSLATTRKVVVRTGAKDDVLTEIATEKTEKKRQRLGELRDKIPVDDFVQLMMESLGKNDESGLTVCEQVDKLCSLNAGYIVACDDAGGPAWNALSKRVFPTPILQAFLNVDRGPDDSPEIDTDPGDEYWWYTIRRRRFFDRCYGLMLADAVGKRAYAVLLERAKVFFENRRGHDLNADVVDATGVDSSYTILNVLASEIDDAVTAAMAAPGNEEMKRLKRGKLFKDVVGAFLRVTGYILFREHNHPMMMPNEQDPPGVDTANETYPLARLRPIAKLAGIHAVAMWKQLTNIRDRRLKWDFGRLHTKIRWDIATRSYREEVFKVLFPTGKTRKGKRIHIDLPRDSGGNSWDTAASMKFTSARGPIMELVRPKLPPGARPAHHADDDDDTDYYDSSDDETEEEEDDEDDNDDDDYDDDDW